MKNFELTGSMNGHLLSSQSKGLSRFFVTAVSLICLFTPNIPTTEAQTGSTAPTAGTRCPTNGETLFLRFNYVPVTGAEYLENKAIIYVPKEAQCAGSFPMHVYLHGNNKHSDDISPYYLPSQANGVDVTAHFTEDGTVHEVRGTNRFKETIEQTMQNPRVPGTIFVLPVIASPHSNWIGLDGATLKTAVENALNSDPQTRGKGITLSNDTLLSGHSGAGCHDNTGLARFPNLNPKAVGVIDTCTNIYAAVSRAYPSSTILFYAATMAYTTATVRNNEHIGGYHNEVQALQFQQLATCDPTLFFRPHNPAGPKSYGKPPSSPFHQYWDNPQLWCSKSPTKPWYGLFATGVDHTTAAGLGMRTLLSLYYAENTPTISSPTQNNQNLVAPPTTNNPQNQPSNITTSNAPLVSGTVPLEVTINGITTISGNDQGYIINYTRILFLYAASLTGALALLVLIVAGIQLILTGSGEKNTQAVQLIVGSVSGLTLLATSGWILYLINPCFFSFDANSTCTPRGTQPTNITYSQQPPRQTINNPAFNLTGTPPPPPRPNCNADNICDVLLPVPYISQIAAPNECTYDNVCATNPNAGDDGGNPKWGQVSCSATAFSIAYLYVSGNSTPARDFLSTLIHQYFRCGIHGLPPARSATIGGYDAVSAPRTYNDNLCAYTLGAGGEYDTLVRITQNELGARGTRVISDLTPQVLYQELSAGHPIVIPGIIKDRGSSNFIPHAHFTVIIGIQGYNQSTGQFTNLVIHDVGRGPNIPLTFANYTSLRATTSNHPPLHLGIAVAM